MTDKELMTLMLYDECRGESQYGKLCVASTVINRLKLAQAKGVVWWGATVSEIIQSPLQYQGFVLRDITEIKNTQEWKSCYQIAIAVLDFEITIPLITHFVTIDYPDFENLEYRFTVGNHKFFREVY